MNPSLTPSPSPAISTTPPQRTAAAVRFLRGRLVRNHIRAILSGSRLRFSMIAVCSAIFWIALFGLFFEGFQFIGSFINSTSEIIEYVFGTFFLGLLVLLLFSTGIILYTSLFGTRETAYLLTTPVPTDQIFAHSFVEAIAFSSWGFLLLGSPMMVAYGIISQAPWPFYVLFLAYLVSFVLIPGALGGAGAILVARFLPRRAKTVLAIIAGGLLIALIYVVARMFQTPGEVFTRDWLDALLSRLTFAQNPILPSHWMSRGLVSAARGNWGDGLFYLMVTAAHAGLAYLIAAVLARDLYRSAYSRVQGGRSSRRRIGLYAVDEFFHHAFGFIPRPVRLLILKDLRTFRRDPAQWSQFLIFFGLLAFYFLNIRKLGYDVASPYWRNMLSFLNLAVTALILSTFTSRFIFPLLSLEGRNFWILGLFPLRRDAILWGKFAFSAGISLVASEILIVLSDLMLRLSPLMIGLHVVTIAILCLGLSGISVGLGARLPNLREDDPSKIAAGFGGTLNLLVSLIFIFLIVAAVALPCHIFLATQDVNAEELIIPDYARFRFWLFMAVGGSLLLGTLATLIPLRMGIKAFNTMEF
jgi:ABC-2 type transport system permease protein